MKTNPLGVGFKIKDMFFDRAAVASHIDPKKRKFLSKFGAFVRTRAKRSIKPGGKSNIISDPGEPPRSHDGSLRKNIFFAYEASSENVVIGPIVLPGKIGAEALEALEFSGETVIERLSRGKRKRERVNIEARPFMTPAFEAEKSNISTIWRSI